MKKRISLLLAAFLVVALATTAVALDDSTACPHCKETVGWTLWDGSPITESGHYYLSKGVTLTAQLELSGLDVVIDLGGNTLEASETKRAFSLSNGSTLSLVDTSAEKTGTVKGATNSSGGGGTIYAGSGSVVNLYSGTITGGITDSYAAEGGTSTSHSGGNIQLDGATFNMYDGTVTGGKSSFGGNFALFNNSVINLYGGTVTGGESSYVNTTALNQALRGGGNMYIASGSVLNMYGGTISDGSARRVGGNISTWTSSTVNMYGGTISGGTSITTEGYTTHSRCSGLFVYRGSNYGSFYMYGGKLDTNLCYYGDSTDMIVYNGMIKNDPTAVINSRGSSDKAVNVLADCACYTTVGAYYTVWHTGASNGTCTCGINYEDKAEQLYKGNHTYEAGVCVRCGDAEAEAPEPEKPAAQPGEGKCDICDKDVFWTAWDGTKRPESGDHFRLTARATMNDVFTVAAGEDLCVDLNGYTLSAASGARAFYVEGTLDIIDSGVNGTVVGSSNANSGGTIYVTSNGKLTIHGGTISGGSVAEGKYGGNIYSTGALNLYGGTITGGSADRGGNIYATKTLNIKNTTITAGNATARGGNIASTGTVNVYEGSMISNGIATSYGGNIYSANAVNIYGGTITGGQSDEACGGNLGLLYADLVMTGGVISDPADYNIVTTGTATGGNGTVNLNGGQITGGNMKIQSGNHSVKTAVLIDGCYIDGGIILNDSSTLAMYSGYLKTMNASNCNALIYGGTVGVDLGNHLAACACAYKNASGTYTIWHPVLTDGVCGECGKTYENTANDHHVYKAGTEAGTCICKYCESTASGFSAVAAGTAYESLTDALTAATTGTTVTLLANTTVDTAVVPSGVILDLNGYTLTANTVTAAFEDARIVDHKKNGALFVAPENLTIMHAGNKLPVATANGIQFAEVTYDRDLETVSSSQTKFRFHFTQDQQSLLAKAVTEKGGTGVKLIITVAYKNAEGEQKTKAVEIDSTIIAKYTSAWGKKQFVATINGTEDITDIHCTVTVESYGVGVDSDTCSVGKEALENKKIMFIGNSFTYYGKCVIDKGQSVYAQSSRENDKGLFYQICNDNGVNINVTNFTFGGHTLEDRYSHLCAADRGHDGLDHMAYITDWDYDYVVMQNGSRSAALNDVFNECEPLMDMFRAANPDVKFVFLVQHQAYVTNYEWIPSIENLEKHGIIVVDWGKLVYDIMTGATAVPGAEQTFNKNSFVVAQSASDGYHQNLLGGYITAVMTYCAITGEKAVGQTYDFGDDHFILGDTAMASYKAKYYKGTADSTYDYSTNFIEILNSDADMQGILKLIDQYLAK